MLSLIIGILVVLTLNNVVANTIQEIKVNSSVEVIKTEKSYEDIKSFPPTSITSLNIGSLFNFSGIRNGAIYYIKNKIITFERREINKDKSYIKGAIVKPYQRGKERRREKRRLKEEERINDMPPIYR